MTAAAAATAAFKGLPSIRTTLATLPLAILAYDNLFSLCRVKGTSMEPTLYEGDVVVVRKSDGLWQRWTRQWPEGSAIGDGKKKTMAIKRISSNEDDADYRWATERAQVLEFEQHHCRSAPHTGWLRTPPVPVTGNIVVFQDPETYPSKWNIKRVIGLGGQTVLGRRNEQQADDNFPSSEPSKRAQERKRRRWSLDEFMTGMKVLTTDVPAYSVWVEGDNATSSKDSRECGPVSKKLLVGVAEYRVWPPWRIGKLDNSHETLLETSTDDDQEISSKEEDDKFILPKHERYRARSYWP